MQLPFYTIGHSTRSLEEFLSLLSTSHIELIVDVRRMPRSRTNPQFNREILAGALHKSQIDYVHIAALGGLRLGGSKASPNQLWQNSSFRNYADYAMTMGFREALGELRDLGHKQRVAIMCAEAVWWRCHRRIIADYLICAGEIVVNILGDRVNRARLTQGATPLANGTIIYP